jgi:hypothetical protein
MNDRNTISGAELCAFTGLTDRRHRQLADDGFFPPPINGDYPMPDTIRGLFRYYREALANREMPLTDDDVKFKAARARRETADAVSAEVRAAVAAKSAAPLDFVFQTMSNLLAAASRVVRTSHLSHAEQDKILAELRSLNVRDLIPENVP